MAKPAQSDSSNSPENVNPVTGEVQASDAARPANRFRQWVQQQATDETDSWEVTARQLDKMLMAEDADAIMNSDEGGTHQGRDLLDFEFEVPSQTFRYANTSPEFDAPLGVYMQFSAVALMDYPNEGILLGEEILISTGAPLVIGKLRTLQANGFLPRKFIMKGYRGGKGVVLKLRPAPNRAVPSTTA